MSFNVILNVDPGYPQRGPYEASEGIYPGRGQGKNSGQFRGSFAHTAFLVFSAAPARTGIVATWFGTDPGILGLRRRGLPGGFLAGLSTP